MNSDSLSRYVLSLAAALMAVLAAGAAHAQARVALVIGISDYANVPSLANPARDAQAIANSLRESGFAVTELTGAGQVSRTGVATAIAHFRRAADTAEAAVIYYAGHGVEHGGTNWLLPADASAASPDDLYGSAISSSLLIGAVKGASTVRLVILDACRDNPFAREPGWAKDMRGGVVQRGLTRDVNRPDNVVVLLATQPGLAASDGQATNSTNSPFASALASSLTTPGMMLAELPAQISTTMRNVDGLEQRPDQQGIFDAPRWTFLAAGAQPMAISGVSQGAALSGATARLIADCDRLAASPSDTQLPPGAASTEIARVLPALAIPACRKALAAAPDNARMAHNLGRALGAGGQFEEGIRLYEQAIAGGHLLARSNLASLYSGGLGVKKDQERAFAMSLEAAELGDLWALHQIGIHYKNGVGVKKDYVAARQAFERGAAAGVKDSMGELASIYYNGQGTPVNYTRAKLWAEMGYERKDPFSTRLLGVMYSTGNGMPRNRNKAFDLYREAAALGDEESIRFLRENPNP